MRQFLTAQGWKRRILAALLGICATAALPPFYIAPLLIPAFAGLFLLVQNARNHKQAFSDGWWWGLGHFVAGLYWICISLYVDPNQFAWLTPFALFGVPGIVAIYTGLVMLALSYVRSARMIVRMLAFAVIWVTVEYGRAHLFTGFPWNLIGYVWTASNASIQSASLVGIYGLGFITVIIATLPALFVQEHPSAVRANLFSLFLLLTALAFGFFRLDAHPAGHNLSTRIRIVQGNIAESKQWTPEVQLQALKKVVDLTRKPGLDAINIVVWPESAIPYYLEPDSLLTRDLGGLLPEHSLLISGGLRGKGDKKDWKAWNSLFAINHEGNIVSQYDKHHLVPFGEFIPFRGILPIENIAGGMGDFSRGPGPATLSAGGYAPYSPLICYEAIFPDEAVDGTHHAQWMVNITNDAWFGLSSGPYQHLEMARMRAVEQGLPLVRAANTGISAVFDSLGRQIKYLPLQTEGVLDMNLPAPIYEKTLISSFVYIPVLFIICLCALFLIIVS